MKVSSFDYSLPPERIAQSPLAERSAARLLDVEGQTVLHARVRDLPARLAPNDLVVVNDTRVLPARLTGRKASGGKVELLLERVESTDTAKVLLRSSKSPGRGTRVVLADAAEAEVLGRDDRFFRLRLVAGITDWHRLLHAHGSVPLPPYIERDADASDRERYQTVFAARDGAVAAPTAGLHLDEDLLAAITARGARLAHTTLHVGAGTFQPVQVDDTREHVMHAESVEVSSTLVAAVAATRQAGGRVVAIGTTVVRALESAAAAGELAPFSGDTRLFITPGYRFRVVNRLFTNFHLPQSTLLMLVCAFGGYRRVLDAYAEAVREHYRFFSYGDAMWLAPGDAEDLPPDSWRASGGAVDGV